MKIFQKIKSFLNLKKTFIIENKKTIIKNYLWFFLIFLVFFLCDWITKIIFFDQEKIFLVKTENWLFGIRSVKNYGTTFFNSIGLKDVKILMHIISTIIAIVILITAAFVKKKIFLFSLGMIFASLIGNDLDRSVYGYVRDIIYVPWVKNGNAGTFNLADLFVVIGAGLFLVGMKGDIINQYKNKKREKHDNKIKR